MISKSTLMSNCCIVEGINVVTNSLSIVSILTPIYSVIQKDGLNFVSLYFKVGNSDKYYVNYI